MADMAYSNLYSEWQNPNFLQRVEVSLVRIAKNNKMEAVPPAASDTTTAAQEDRLARAIVANSSYWASFFGRLVAIQLIGSDSLLDTSVVTDGALDSAIAAIYDNGLPSL